MKAEVILDDGTVRAVEVTPRSGHYLVRIQDPESGTWHELIADYCAQSSALSLLVDGASYLVELTRRDREYHVAVGPHRMHARVRTAEDRLRELLHKTAGTGHDTIKAGMPGAVLEVFVQPGDVVSEGQRLMILEAMKMENTIRAPQAGTIEAVKVTKGQNVQTGEILIAFEAAL